MRRVWVALMLVAASAPGRLAQAHEAIATEAVKTSPPPVAVPQHSADLGTRVPEDPNFDPYDENAENGAGQARKNEKYQPKQRKVEIFDFDPSEGLTFHVYAGKQECFFENVKTTADELSGAYIVSSADSHIDLEIKNPEGVVIYRRFGDAEGQYQVRPTEEGVHELCFINSDSDGKLVTHVTNSLQSQHPVEREHVSVLAKYASHVDVRLGELESEQRLQQIRTDRFIKIEESTSQRVAFYGTLECFVYFLICLYQVLYIKGLLDGPRPARTKQWA